MIRPALTSLALALSLAPIACPHAESIEPGLPELGSSADTLISPAEEREYARQMMGEMRALGMLVEDPLLEDYLQDLGDRLAANSALPGTPFTFFLLRERVINAFATFGGHVAVNSGLLLATEREDELAAVMAHEITHVTQRHLVRGAESAQKDALPIALATLAAVALAHQAGGSSSGNATEAAVAGGMALMAQRQINFTRSNEQEADRIGIQILARTGYDPMAMADFFGRLLRSERTSADVPELLRTHPVTTSRISEAKDRAEHVIALRPDAIAPTRTPLNPALPSLVGDSLGAATEAGQRFAFARERMRVLSAASPAEAAAEYRRRVSGGETLNDAERYGQALAQAALGNTEPALGTLTALRQQHPALYWLDLAIADVEHQRGDEAAADRQFADLLHQHPDNRAIALDYARVLAERGRREDGVRAQDVLRPLLARGKDDPTLQRVFARACELAGDLVRAGEAHAEVAWLNGRPMDALDQLQRLKQRSELDYVQRARIDARIAALTPVVLELRAEGVRPGGEQRINRGVTLR